MHSILIVLGRFSSKAPAEGGHQLFPERQFFFGGPSPECYGQYMTYNTICQAWKGAFHRTVAILRATGSIWKQNV